MNDPEWVCDFRTADPAEFLQVLWDSRECMAFIDEAGDAVGRYNDVMNRTATRGRHWGHVMHYCMQKVQQVAPIVRDQCTKLCLFASSASDGKLLADEFGHDELRDCNLLVTGEFFLAQKMGDCKRVNMFNLRSRIDASRNTDDRRITDDGNGRRITHQKEASTNKGTPGEGTSGEGTPSEGTSEGTA